jgi:hypothetical protein
VQEAISVDAWNRMEDVNAVIFHLLKDNLLCQETGARVATGSWTKLDPSCRGHLFLEHKSPAVLS